jgi:hypothetical protein
MGYKSNIYFRLILISSVIAFSVSSCQKGEEASPENIDPNNEPVEIREYLPIDSTSSGTLIAVKYQKIDDTGLSLSESAGHATAIFPGLSNYQSAGNVSVLQLPMSENTNHIYNYKPQQGTTGINYSQGSSRWDISGSLTVPTSSFIVPGGFPEISGLTNFSEELDRSDLYTFGTVEPISNADSVRFAVFSSGSFVFANKLSSNHSHTFDPNLLQHLDPGNGIIMITAFRWVDIDVSNTRFTVLHQTSTYKNIHIK